jgi:choline dehydrogenase-like flavoprotein
MEDCDALGVPRVALDWRLSELDKRTVRVMIAELDSTMRKGDFGRVEAAPWLSRADAPWEHDSLVSLHPIGGYHHMGTTRMATDARFGVVDANCRVHEIANLFIAGSSVFPTSGWANPTLTILALSLRLADHLLFTTARYRHSSLICPESTVSCGKVHAKVLDEQ